MIGWLKGYVVHMSGSSLIIQAGAVGYEVTVPKSDRLLPNVTSGFEIELHVHTHVREDAIQLFGFLTLEDKMLFLELTGIDGVGPKTAMSVLSSMTFYDFASAVRTKQIPALCSIPGIGKKTAERIIMELGDKYGATAVPAGKAADLVRGALMKMGYKRPQADKALSKMKIDDRDTAELIKEALSLV